MLATGKSFRTNRDADAIRSGLDLAVVRGEARVRAGTIALACSVVQGARGARKTYTLNGRDVRYASYLGKVRVVTFVPADLQLATGAPALRRALLNIALSQEEPRYYHELARYRKALQQKNALLRDAGPYDPELYAIYEQTLVEAGTAISLARNHYVAAVAEAARKAHERFSAGSERLDVRYEPNVAFEVPTADGVAAALAARFKAVADVERARRGAIAGPHRDDIGLEIDGRALGAYGSQGQQRTAVLALKVAEYAVMHERSNEAPLLLLDDVLSELDEERAAAFLDGIGDYEQAFVTATHVPPGLPAGARVARVREAQVEAGAPC
jgi:DNA replication and repair protein RecF